jgi:hypothetical protein
VVLPALNGTSYGRKSKKTANRHGLRETENGFVTNGSIAVLTGFATNSFFKIFWSLPDSRNIGASSGFNRYRRWQVQSQKIPVTLFSTFASPMALKERLALVAILALNGVVENQP